MNVPAKKIIVFFFIISAGCSLLTAQDCGSKYLSFNFRGTTFDTFSHAVFTPNNEIIAAGSLLDYNGAAHLAKYSKNGLPIWSNYYTIGFFTFYNPTFFSKIRFNDFVLTADGGIVVAGTVLRYYNNRVAEILSEVALLAKIDKYGIVEWTRSYMPAGGYADLSFSNIHQTTDGDFIVYMAHDKGPSIYSSYNSHNRVVRFSATGQLKWATSLYTGLYDAGGREVFFKRGITQLTDKNIVIGDVVYQTERKGERFKMYDGRLHFFSLDYNTGKMNWESNYPYTLPAADTFFVPDIDHVAQLPDGRLSFTTSLYLSTASNPALTKKPVTIITDNRGVAQKLVTYYSSSGNDIRLTDVTKGNISGEKKLLFDDGGVSVAAAADKEGAIIESRGYTGLYPPNCFATGPRGTAIFMSNNQSLSYKMLLTDANGSAECADTPVSILTEPLTPVNDNPAIVVTVPMVYTQADYKDYFVDMEYPLKIKSEYPLLKTVDCEQPIECCKDIIDTVNIRKVTICEGTNYKLPDNTVVKDPGLYYVANKSVTGCDSITYTRITVNKSLAPLTLGNDTCLTGQSGFLIHATPGYTAYSWMGGAGVSADSFRVGRPGTYSVRVTNACGTKADSIEIYDRCDFPIFMPNAFTPNRDNLNDDFGVPFQNKNRLISLKVYNRWGQVIFETNSVYKRWNGNYKDQVLKTDIFVYYLVMQGLSGNIITQKGKLMLIR
jgi:gliding motility-associated-like protein